MSRSAWSAAVSISSTVTSSGPSTGRVGPLQMTFVPHTARKGESRKTPTPEMSAPRM